MHPYFRNLNYTMGDEDASVEMHLLPHGRHHVVAVADCGSRIVPLLAKCPRKIQCVDVNQEQLAVCRMRLALLRQCELAEYRAFLGYDGNMSSQWRKQIFARLPIRGDHKYLLQNMFDSVQWEPILYHGRFERLLRTLSTAVRFLAGQRMAGIFKARDLDEQRKYYHRHFPRRRWLLALALLGNAAALNCLLYQGSFPRKNIRGSHFAIYKTIFERLFTEQPARDSFFLQMLLLGKLDYEEGYPVECAPNVYAKAKAALATCEVDFVHGDVFEEIEGMRDVDFVSLSDVPSFIAPHEARHFLARLKPGLAEGAMVVVRAHLRRVMPDVTDFTDISARFQRVTANEATRLWSFDLYQYR